MGHLVNILKQSSEMESETNIPDLKHVLSASKNWCKIVMGK